MVMVGDAIQAELEAQGIGVIHAADIHDYPSYNGSYARSRETIMPILEKYPSIKVVLDIHRDAISGDGTGLSALYRVDGKEAAQIMIISGCDDGTLGMPNYMENFHFACALQSKLESDHKGFTRPILFDYRHYNQDLTNGSLLIEVGSHGNTLEQVQYAGQLFGKSLGELLRTMRKEIIWRRNKKKRPPSGAAFIYLLLSGGSWMFINSYANSFNRLSSEKIVPASLTIESGRASVECLTKAAEIFSISGIAP